MKRVSVYLHEDVYETLKRISKEGSRTYSSIIREGTHRHIFRGKDTTMVDSAFLLIDIVLCAPNRRRVYLHDDDLMYIFKTNWGGVLRIAKATKNILNRADIEFDYKGSSLALECYLTDKRTPSKLKKKIETIRMRWETERYV